MYVRMYEYMYVCTYVCHVMSRYDLSSFPIAITSPSLQHPLLLLRLQFQVCSLIIFSLRLDVIMRNSIPVVDLSSLLFQSFMKFDWRFVMPAYVHAYIHAYA